MDGFMVSIDGIRRSGDNVPPSVGAKIENFTIGNNSLVCSSKYKPG